MSTQSCQVVHIPIKVLKETKTLTSFKIKRSDLVSMVGHTTGVWIPVGAVIRVGDFKINDDQGIISVDWEMMERSDK